MKLRQLFEDKSGVSPVIGVILMVAITVILAAVIGTFVLNLGQNVNNSAPTVSFDFEDDSGTTDVDITHNGGAELDASNIDLNNCDSNSPDPNPWTAGETHTCTVQTSGDPIRIVWNDPGSDQTSIIGEYDTS